MLEIERPSKENNISQACYLSRIMHALNDRYFDEDLTETTRERLGLVSTYIYAVGDSSLRKHSQYHSNQLPTASLDQKITNAAILDLNQLPEPFTYSIENLVNEASEIYTPPNKDQAWEAKFKQHVITWEHATGVTPEAFGLTESKSKTTRLSKFAHLLSPLLPFLPRF